MSTIWFTLAIQILKILRWYFKQMSPEEKIQLSKMLEDWKKQIADMPMPPPPPLEGK